MGGWGRSSQIWKGVEFSDLLSLLAGTIPPAIQRIWPDRVMGVFAEPWSWILLALATFVIWRSFRAPYEILNDQNSQLDQIKAKKINEARHMLASYPEDGTDPQTFFKRHAAYLNIKPYLSSDMIETWNRADATFTRVHNKVTRSEIVDLGNALDALEKRWGLRH